MVRCPSDALTTIPKQSIEMQLAKTKYVTVDNLKVHYAEAGEGPVVLLVHGLGSSLITWYRNMDPLVEAGYRVIALDLPGHGDSDKPRDMSYDPNAAPTFLKQFLEATGVERAVVVGNSAGGLLVAMFAMAHPEMVDKVVLVSSGGLGPEVSWFLRIVSVPGLGELLYQPQFYPTNDMFRHIFYQLPPFLDELIPEMQRVRNLPGSRHAAIQSIRSSINLLGLRKQRYILDRLKHLPAPLMIVWGREDTIIPVSHANLVSQELPQSVVHILSECGHWPHMEKSEEFNAHLLRFLLDSAGHRAPALRQ